MSASAASLVRLSTRRKSSCAAGGLVLAIEVMATTIEVMATREGSAMNQRSSLTSVVAGLNDILISYMIKDFLAVAAKTTCKRERRLVLEYPLSLSARDPVTSADGDEA